METKPHKGTLRLIKEEVPVFLTTLPEHQDRIEEDSQTVWRLPVNIWHHQQRATL